MPSDQLPEGTSDPEIVTVGFAVVAKAEFAVQSTEMLEAAVLKVWTESRFVLLPVVVIATVTLPPCPVMPSRK
jgi:hypothetical protein